MKKVCEYCLEEYVAIRKDQKFCSSYCRLKHLRSKGTRRKLTEIKCAQCGAVFIPIRIDQRFCSVHCKDAFYGSHQVKNKTCLCCGKDFITTSHKKKYCSKNCYKIMKAVRDSNRKR